MQGTLINAAAIVAGSLIGLVIHKKLSKSVVGIVFSAIGLFTLFIGVQMAMETSNLVIMIVSIVSGSIFGEWLDIDNAVNRFGEFLKNKFKAKNDRFSEGFVTSFLLFCMGSMTILGAIEEGMGGKPNLFMAKSVLDGVSSVALSVSMGIGVVFSAIPLFLYQGGLTLFAGSLQDTLTMPIVNEVTAVGGLMLIGMGLNILEIKKLKILNMLPALVVAGLLAHFFI
jgi:uncharacterized protein